MDSSKLRAFRKVARKAVKAQSPEDKQHFSSKLAELSKGMDKEVKAKYVEKYGLQF